MIRSLHVEAMRHHDLHAEREPHVLFQASTIGALLEGAYEGDVSFAELAEHGDLGLGTLNALDGEMIALDGRFLRADVDGAVTEIDASTRTPFAVVINFSPTLEFDSAHRWDTTSSSRRSIATCRRRRRLCAAARRRVRASEAALGPPPVSAIPAADRGGRRAASVRALRRRGHRGRLSLPRLQPGPRGRRLPPPLRHPDRTRGGHVLEASPSKGSRSGSTSRQTSTSSSPRESTSPPPTSARQPTTRWRG